MTKKISLFFILLLLASIAIAKAPYEDTNAPYTDISSKELIDLQKKNIPVYDIRRPEEWKQTGIVDNSITLTYFQRDGSINPDFMDKFSSEVGKDDPFVLICRSGRRSSALANYLANKAGYTKIYNVEHGIMGWIGEKLPVAAF